MTLPRAIARNQPGRILVERLIFVAIAGLFVQTWFFQGVVTPCRVASGSMAETLLGLHREVICADCGFSFACGIETADCRPGAVCCPNCGFSENRLATAPNLAGDGVLIARSAFHFRSPRRWEVVAFRGKEDAEQVLVKRVVGLPGESIQIRDGDIYIDGKLQRKPLSEQLAVAVLVHSASFASRTSELPARWQGDGEQSQWGVSEGRFAHPAGNGKTLSNEALPDWLEYRHWTRKPSHPGKVQETPIFDELGYNQNLSRREEERRAVTDVMLEFRVIETFGRGRLLLRGTDGREEFETQLDPVAGQWSAFRNGEPIPGQTGKLPPLAGAKIVFSLFDQQLLLAVDGQTLLAWPYEPADRPKAPTARPLKIATQGLGMVLDDLRVYRDVYYTRPTGFEARWALDRPFRLSANEFFVLGDNSAVSVDSRIWPNGPVVESKFLFGKPLAVLFPAMHVAGWGLRFQVPDPCRIRYIR